MTKTINDASSCLNMNDKAMWLLGWNAAEEAKPLSAKRAALITELTEFISTMESGGAVRSVAMARKAIDMLEADAQRQAGDEISIKCYQAQVDDLQAQIKKLPKSFVQERAQLEQEWCELRALKRAQQVAVPPVTHPDAVAALEAMNKEYNYPANPANCARYGWEAARRYASAPQPPQAAERVPMTHEQAKALVAKHGATDPLNLIFRTEQHHRIGGAG